MAERVTEEQLAGLEAKARRLARETETNAAFSGSSIMGARIRADSASEAEREYLAAKAQFERQQREDADAVTRQMLQANQDMAQASKEAARASADSARWAKWAAVFGAAAAGVTLLVGVLQLVFQK